FFSSRRRHTRSKRDWSSDVCSSDLEQIRIAAGAKLSLRQNEISTVGHAVEARVYAENPTNDFMPSTGTVLHISEPTGAGIRVDRSEERRVGKEWRVVGGRDDSASEE